ncbi:unnamed protein product [Paramecium primaurelia]|uniref:Uncharacterized protein n=1 Tax=Paramecium primaurelia TaxID=5886 RepID=A0A8S1Q9W1_PARPR|nr:unnamed protein product [Paramecium primaurelia]
MIELNLILKCINQQNCQFISYNSLIQKLQKDLICFQPGDKTENQYSLKWKAEQNCVVSEKYILILMIHQMFAQAHSQTKNQFFIIQVEYEMVLDQLIVKQFIKFQQRIESIKKMFISYRMLKVSQFMCNIWQECMLRISSYQNNFIIRQFIQMYFDQKPLMMDFNWNAKNVINIIKHAMFFHQIIQHAIQIIKTSIYHLLLIIRIQQLDTILEYSVLTIMLKVVVLVQEFQISIMCWFTFRYFLENKEVFQSSLVFDTIQVA